MLELFLPRYLDTIYVELGKNIAEESRSGKRKELA